MLSSSDAPSTPSIKLESLGQTATSLVLQEQLRSGEVTEKVCSKCDQLLHITEFSSWMDPRTHLQRWQVVCRSCLSKASRIRNAAKKHAPPKSEVCDSCFKPLLSTGKGKYSANLDHDPETHEFRGWLCSNCNKGVGMLGDNLLGVLQAAEYLARTKGLLLLTSTKPTNEN